MLAALEAAWSAIRSRHQEVPEAVLIIAPGTGAGQVKWGHFAALRWQYEAGQLHEVLVSGEGLSRPATSVLATLLHEAVHALAHVRGVQDTSRQGRWHNKRFAALAGELGLEVNKSDKTGWSQTTLTRAAAEIYDDTLTRLKTTIRLYRRLEVAVVKSRANSNNSQACECACPRKIRVIPSVFDQGPITCGVCDTDFEPCGGDR